MLNKNQDDEAYEKTSVMYKSLSWESRKANGSIESVINRFEDTLRVEFSTLSNERSSNLTMAQKYSLNHIRNQKELKFLLADKNLGLLVVSRDDHVKAMAGLCLIEKHMELFQKRKLMGVC